MDTINDLFEAWTFLGKRQIIDDQISKDGGRYLHIEVVRVNPVTKQPDAELLQNTETRIWVEYAPYLKPEILTPEERKRFPHGISDIDIDCVCGGATFEEAIIALARLVQEKYGS